MVDNQTKISKIYNKYHCVEGVRIRSYSGPHFSSFGLNIERYFVSLRIQSECGKLRPRKNSVFGHFSRSVGHVTASSLSHLRPMLLFCIAWKQHEAKSLLVFSGGIE